MNFGSIIEDEFCVELTVFGASAEVRNLSHAQRDNATDRKQRFDINHSLCGSTITTKKVKCAHNIFNFIRENGNREVFRVPYKL